MRRGDDYGVNEDSNLSQLEPDSVSCVSQGKQSKTTTLTDNKKRDYENNGSSVHDDSCIGINFAHAHKFTKCFKSFHTLLGFALVLRVVNFNYVAVAIYSILTCTRIPCRDSHCGNGSFEVLSLHLPSVAADRRQL